MEGKTRETREQLPKRVFIEVGTYSLPIPWHGSRKFGENETYIGIDRNRENVEHAEELSKLNFPDAKNLYFIQADAAKLPLGDATADEVFLGNVLGDNSIMPTAKDKFIEEIKRVLKESGKIIIKETNTPAPLKYLRDLLRKHGLYVEKGVTAQSTEWPAIISQYESSATQPQNIESARTLEAYVAFVKRLPNA